MKVTVNDKEYNIKVIHHRCVLFERIRVG